MKTVLAVLTFFMSFPCLAQDRPAVKITGDEEQTFSGGRPVFTKEKAKDDFGKLFEGYVQVDESWQDVRIVRSRTASGKTPDVGSKFTGAPRVSIVERVEPMYVDWVQDDEEEWVFSPVLPIGWFDRIVVRPSEKEIFAEKIEKVLKYIFPGKEGVGVERCFEYRLCTYEAKEVVGADRCFEYRCGALYKFEQKPSSCLVSLSCTEER